MEAEASKVISHSPLGHSFGRLPEKRSKILAKVAIAKPVGKDVKDNDGGQENLNALFAVTKTGDALIVDRSRKLHVVEFIFADGAVVADSLDVKKTSVGLEADLPELWKVVKSFADPEVTRVVDGCFRSEGASLLYGIA